jgi:Xaa-Pro dipeptidase
MSDIPSRRQRLRELLDERGLAGVVLRRPANFAWYTGGGDSKVEIVAPEGVADVVVSAEAEYVFTSAIEAPRMRSEQAVGFEVVEYPWYEDRDAALRELAGGRLGADVPIAGAADLSQPVDELRRVLDPDAAERLRAVGRDATAAMADATSAVERGMSEFEAAAALTAACKRRGLTATVLLAAGDERIRQHRHPVPVGARIERRAMLVASAERGGLYANLTRIVDLEEPEPELSRRLEACEEILRRMREEATRPGRTLAEAFLDCERFYSEAGFPDEWKLHHQGGTTGYGSREVIATPSTHDPIRVGNAFAWNPSIAGGKAEETFLLTDGGPEVVAGAAVAVA